MRFRACAWAVLPATRAALIACFPLSSGLGSVLFVLSAFGFHLSLPNMLVARVRFLFENVFGLSQSLGFLNLAVILNV